MAEKATAAEAPAFSQNVPNSAGRRKARRKKT
jgi:hypothetical protein